MNARQSIVRAVTPALVLVLTACGTSEDPTQPILPPVEELPSVLPPDPDGMPLPGDPDDPALPPVTLLPTPAAPEHIADNLLLSRLTAVLDPGATVAEVNDALSAHEAAIVSMAEGSPLVSVVIPAVGDLAGAEAVAASLEATAGFAEVWPGRMPTLAPSVESTPVKVALNSSEPPRTEALDYAIHTIWSRLPSIWSLRKAALADTRIIIPYWFPARPDLTEIPNFTLLPDYGLPVPESDPVHRASAEGHHLAGIAGANWNFEVWQWHTGIDPMNELLQLHGISTYGMTFAERMTALAQTRPAGRTVVLSAQSYLNPEFDSSTHLERLYDAMHWRRMIAHVIEGTDFAHVVAAGRPNQDEFERLVDDARWNTPFALATVPDLRSLAVLYANESEAATFVTTYDNMVAAQPATCCSEFNTP